ncbi:retrovirus-related pol polyprotein from transposon TNT 1-94, partial [Tanacetum coccineum]
MKYPHLFTKIAPLHENRTLGKCRVLSLEDKAPLMGQDCNNLLFQVPTTTKSKVVTNDKVIAPGMFRINLFKTSREDKFMPVNKVRASVRTNSITVSQSNVIAKKDVNSNSNGLSSTGVDITTKTRRPQPRRNTKNDRVPSASKSSCIKNKEFEVEEHHRNLLLSKNKKHMSSECNNIKLAIWNDKSKVICVMCKQCLLTSNHDVCVLNYVNGMNSRDANQCANVSNVANQNKHKPKVWKSKKLGSKERLASPKPSKHRSCLRVYFIEGLGHNLFSVGEFCDSDLEVAFRRNTCFVRNLKGVDLLKGNRTTNLYTINLHEMASTSRICLMAHTTSTKSWLWHQRLSHLNFDTINDLAKNDLVVVLPKFKYHKEHICPSCEQGNSKKASHPPKRVPNSKQRLHFIHMDLCGPMRVKSINGKRSKDEAPEVIKTFLKKIQVLLQAPVIINDREYIGKLGAKGDIDFFIGYSVNSCAYKVYNRRTKKIMETMNVTFYELSTMAFEQSSSKPRLQIMTSRQICSGLDLTYAPSKITAQQPTEPARRTSPTAQAHQAPQSPMATTTSADTDVDELEPQQQHVQQQDDQAPLQPETVADNVSNAMLDRNTFVNPFATPSTSAAESSPSQYVDPLNMHMFYQPCPHEYHTMEPSNVKEAMKYPAWIDSMQEELLQFKRLDKQDSSGCESVPPKGRDTFLAYDAHKTFIVFQMDVKTAFLHVKQGIIWVKASTKGMYQAKPTEKHLKEVKRIFRYLQGTINMGLWYIKDSGFELTGFSNADYAGCKDTFKSTSSGTQFLGENMRSTRFYQLSHSEIFDIEKVAVRSNLRLPNNRCALIEPRAIEINQNLTRTQIPIYKMSVILSSTHSDEWKSFQIQHQTALRKYGESNASALDDPTLRAGNPVKEILLKLNLPDHRYSIIYCKIVLMELKVNLCEYKALQSNPSLLFVLSSSQPLKGVLRVECFVRVEGYRGNGEVGIGEGELGRVLGRWYGLETVGKGWFEDWRESGSSTVI